MRVVLDTNIVVSAAISPNGNPAEIIMRWENDEFTWIVSTALLEELQEVFNYPRISRRILWSVERAQQFIKRLRESAEAFETSQSIPLLRDPDDEMILEASIAGQADFIVSGDRDLLDLGSYEGIEIVSPTRFLAILREASSR